MPTPEEALKHYWGFDSFRPMQREIVQQPLDGRDALALLPTGGGKSVCFQVPALCMEGVCVVISPLIALMKDQVANLRAKGITAVAVHSGMRFNEIDTALDNCVHGAVKFLYLSPERLRAEVVQVRLRMMRVCLLAVDEAHCISQWGYDFRPPYLRIAEIREQLPGVPVLALTATATPDVVADIQAKLAFQRPNVLSISFQRDNLSYMAFRESDTKGRLLRLYGRVAGSSVIYVRNRRRTQEVARFLGMEGISATYYHAGLSPDERDRRQEDWLSGRTRVMVATNAFGMGIDKPDVRTVVHLGFPDSLEAYFQEAGRAGRDGQRSYAVALFTEQDIIGLRERLAGAFPTREFIGAVYNALGNVLRLAIGSGDEEWYELDIPKLCEQYSWKPDEVLRAIAFLERSEHLTIVENSDPRPTVRFTLSPDALYDLEVRNPRMARVTRTLLRSYGRMFEDHVPISEQLIAKRAGLETAQLIATLHKLHGAGVLDYRPSKGLPKVNFTGGRLRKEDILIPRSVYEERKVSVANTLRAAEHFLQNRLVCRSVLLLTYFGEKDAAPCGHCDVCIAKRASPPSASELSDAKAMLRPLLHGDGMTADSAVAAVPSLKEAVVLSALSQMLDDGEISVGLDGRLTAEA